MAIEKIVNIKVNTDQADKNVKGLTNSIKETTKETQNSGQAYTGLIGKIDLLTGGAITKFRAMYTSLTTVSLGFKGVGAAIALSGLGLLIITIAAISAAFKNTEDGQNKFAKLMGVIGSVTGNLIDLLANLGEKIIYVFENPKKSLIDFGNLIKQNIVNRFEGMLELFPAISKAIKLVFEGEFSKAGEVAFNAVSKVTTGIANTTGKIKGLVKGTQEYAAEIQREAKIAAKIADDRAKADILERNLINKKADAENKINLLREKSIQTDKFSTSQRTVFLKEALKISDDIALQEVKVAKLRANAKTAENALSGSTKEDLKEEAELRANITRIDTTRLAEQRRIASTIQALQREELSGLKSVSDGKKKIKDDADKADAEALKKSDAEKLAVQVESLKQANEILRTLTEAQETPAQKEEREYLAKFEILTANNLSTELLEADHKAKLAKINNDYFIEESKRAEVQTKKDQEEAKKKEQIEKDLAQAKKEIQDSTINVISQGIGLLAQLGGKNKAIQKAAIIAESAVGVAKVIINTQAANALAKANPLNIPTAGVYGTTQSIINTISGGIGIASNLLATSKALGSLGGGAAPSATAQPNSGGGGGSAAPSAPSFNVVGGTNSNQIAESLGGQNRPIQAFVVSSSVTSGQELDRNAQNRASI
jgi:hypothetical protein